MPSWRELLTEVKEAGSTYDLTRRKYLSEYSKISGRNAVVYYSGWLQKGALHQHGYTGFSLNDSDKNGLMTAFHRLDKSKGLDLFLHTPGGELAATESLVDYVRSMFSDVRAVVPQLAMSAGTMIALSCNEILMGKHSSLGPIDPQIFGLPAHGILEEFREAAKQVKSDQSLIYLWQPIIGKYTPTLIGECQKAIVWCNEMVKEWLVAGMFAGEADAETKADRIIEELGDHSLTKSHARHISIKRAKEIGIKVKALEENQELQEIALTVHHACIQTLSATPACKIIENHLGAAYIETFQSAAM